MNNPGGLIIGAGAASKHDVGTNAELVMNIRTGGGEHERLNETRCARVDPVDETKPMLIHYQNELNSADFTLLGNIFISQGDTKFFVTTKKYNFYLSRQERKSAESNRKKTDRCRG